MKNKFKLLFILMFAGILSASAQGGGQQRTPEERAKMQVDRMTDSLKLTTAQQGDVTNTLVDYYKAMTKLREGLAPGTRPEKADTDKITADRDAKLKVILKEEQFNHFKDMEAAMRQRQQRQQ